jgi:hypothetical protein
MPRVAFQTLCSYARYLDVSTVHMIEGQRYFASFIVERL